MRNAGLNARVAALTAGLGLCFGTLVSVALFPLAWPTGDHFLLLSQVGVLAGIGMAGRTLRQPFALTVACLAVIDGAALSWSELWDPFWFNPSVTFVAVVFSVAATLAGLTIRRPASIGRGRLALAWLGGLTLITIAVFDVMEVTFGSMLDESFLVNTRGWYGATLLSACLLALPLGMFASYLQPHPPSSARIPVRALLLGTYGAAILGALIAIPVVVFTARAGFGSLPTPLGAVAVGSVAVILPVLLLHRLVGLPTPPLVAAVAVFAGATSAAALDLMAVQPSDLLLLSAVVAWFAGGVMLLRLGSGRIEFGVHVAGGGLLIGVVAVEDALFGSNGFFPIYPVASLFNMTPGVLGYLLGGAIGLGWAATARSSETETRSR